MITFAVNENNDIYIGADGSVATAHDKNAALIVAEQFARASRGEMIHKMDKGMPFFDVAFGSQTNPTQYEASFRRRMSEIPQIRSVTEFEAQSSDGVLKYTATIETIYGSGAVNSG